MELILGLHGYSYLVGSLEKNETWNSDVKSNLTPKNKRQSCGTNVTMGLCRVIKDRDPYDHMV